jgi:hypothetical protein
MCNQAQLFAGPSEFVSFPVLMPLSYAPELLDFSRAYSDARVLKAMSELSFFTCCAPRNVVYRADGDTLWKLYDDYLDCMILAKEPAPLMSDNQQLVAAEKLLFDDEGGRTRASPAYSQYQLSHGEFVAAARRRAFNGYAMELLSDPVQSIAESAVALHSAIAEIKRSWNDQAVEKALNIVRAEHQRSPARAWKRWRDAYLPDLDELTEPGSGMRFAPVAVAPSNFVDGDWLNVSLAAVDVLSLAAGAPLALRSALAAAVSTPSIHSLSYEVTSVELIRPWFAEEMLDARFWTLPPNVTELSNGSGQGTFTAIITGIVLVRNVRMYDDGGPQTLQSSSSDLAPVAAYPEREWKGRSQSFWPGVYSGDELVAKQVTVGSIRVRPGWRAILLSGKARQIFVEDAPKVALDHPASMTIDRWPSVSSPNPARDNISVLAFICRTIPRCPNPDLSLSWPTVGGG